MPESEGGHSDVVDDGEHVVGHAIPSEVGVRRSRRPAVTAEVEGDDSKPVDESDT